MKKIIVLLIIIFLGSFMVAKADKPTNYVKCGRVTMEIEFNVEDEDSLYVPIRVNADAPVYTEDGGLKRMRVWRDYGTPAEDRYTMKQIYQLLPAQLQTVLKDLYLEAINEDVSQ